MDEGLGQIALWVGGVAGVLGIIYTTYGIIQRHQQVVKHADELEARLKSVELENFDTTSTQKGLSVRYFVVRVWGLLIATSVVFAIALNSLVAPTGPLPPPPVCSVGINQFNHEGSSISAEGVAANCTMPRLSAFLAGEDGALIVLDINIISDTPNQANFSLSLADTMLSDEADVSGMQLYIVDGADERLTQAIKLGELPDDGATLYGRVSAVGNVLLQIQVGN